MKLFSAALVLVSCFSVTAMAQIRQKSVPNAILPKAPATIGTQSAQQNENGKIILHWNKPVTENFPQNGSSVDFLNFNGALYDAKVHSLPQYTQHTKLNSGTNQVVISLINPVYELLSSSELTIVKSSSGNFISSDVVLNYGVVTENRQPYAYLRFIPIKKTSNGQYEKLISFSLDIKQGHTLSTARTARTSSVSFAANSVLANGKWYRIGVPADGIYKLDYNFFKNMGYDMTKLDPTTLRIYGNGGQMLPDSNKTYRPDDLVENPIYVSTPNHSLGTSDYVLFYGQGPNSWKYNAADKHYHHQVNLYSDTTYYFITDDLGGGKRITTEPSGGVPTDTVISFDDYAYHEADAQNLIQSGSEWFGETFDAITSYNISFNFPNIVSPSLAYINVAIASRCDISSNYQIGPSTTVNVPPVSTSCYFCSYAAMGTNNYTITPASSTINVNISKLTSGAVGWLYYVEANARRNLTMTSGNMQFRDVNSVGAGKVSLFNIGSFIPIQVWDITHPQNVQVVTVTNPISGSYQFVLSTDSLKQFMAFDGTTFGTPKFFGEVANQNLHALPQADLTIIANPMFYGQANQLAKFHASHDGLKVNLVTTQQVYNEFSSGRQDPIAIRDFMRMFYTRASNYATSPKYLLLFGGASYDPKSRLQNNTNFIVGYESPESFDPTASFISDDYYALLDSTEGPLSGLYSLDISVGRFPVSNVTDAQTVVNKIISYETPTGEPIVTSTNCCNPQGQYNMANWRNSVCFLAHDGDGGIHETQADTIAKYVTGHYRNLNVNKIFCDAYPEVQTPGGPRYPAVNTAIDQQMDNGLLVINYTGHGGPLGLAAQRILSFSDIYSWTNINKLSLFFTASCEFARFDNPGQVSAGALCLTVPSGGNIGLMTTTRDTYSPPNFGLDYAFWQSFYKPLPDGSLPRTGDLFVMAKNGLGPSLNSLMFAYMGDPAVRLAYPQQCVYTSAINAIAVAGPADTLRALSKVTITGYVGDASGNPLTSFNGLLYPIIYDKPDSITTLNNPSSTGNIFFPFSLQKNILYKGRISVVNGQYSFTFVIPKDINYKYGFGKISYYAESPGADIDATGNYQNIVIGGSSPTARNNGRGPQVRLYMNDSTFVYGGLTNENPQLYAIIFDSNGVNTTSNGIGHNISAVIDNNTQNTYDVTSYFQPALNSYQKGTILYPFSNLSAGKHSLSLRVWNVYNNSSQSYTEFNVQPKSSLELNHVLNYPNPFTTHTQFYFEINEACDVMEVQIQVFTVSGKLVRNIYTSVKSSSFRPSPVDWDGRDDYGDKIANGVYIYHLKVRTSEGSTADTYQKLVIL
jgi:hypothetical protein